MVRRLPRLFPVAALILATAGCSHRAGLQNPATQGNYGVEMARMNLWREAMFRFQRAVAVAPGDPMAHNNLAVAYEANGDFEKARKEYLEALRLDRTNSYIQKNYSRYVEFLSRSRKRSTGKNASSGSKLPGAPTGVRGGAVDGVPPDPVPVEVRPPQPLAPPGVTPTDFPPPPAVPPVTPPPASSGAQR